MNRVTAWLSRPIWWLRRERLLLPVIALALLLIEAIAVRVVYMGTFGPDPQVAEGAALPLGHAVLGGLGVSALVTGLVGTYRLARRGRLITAALAVPLLCFPVAVAATASLYASLVMAAIL